MSVLITDSNCEIWYTRAEELGLDYISMPYTYCGEVYGYDLGKNTDFKKFYSAVRGGAVPKTMALNPEEYKEFLTPYFEKGEDVLYISFSHKMSGTFSSLEKALEELKEKFPERRCEVFDTKAISIGSCMQAERAARLKKSGASDGEIIDDLRKFTNRVAVYFVVDDLMHLKRGGRLSGAAAVAGTMLKLKPVLTFDSEGGLTVIEKVVGRRKAVSKLAEKVINGVSDPCGEIIIADADCADDAELLAGQISQKLPGAKIRFQPVGPVIGAHCGPGTLAVAFVAEKRPVPLK